jgi:hypothetical protein
VKKPAWRYHYFSGGQIVQADDEFAAERISATKTRWEKARPEMIGRWALDSRKNFRRKLPLTKDTPMTPTTPQPNPSLVKAAGFAASEIQDRAERDAGILQITHSEMVNKQKEIILRHLEPVQKELDQLNANNLTLKALIASHKTGDKMLLEMLPGHTTIAEGIDRLKKELDEAREIIESGHFKTKWPQHQTSEPNLISGCTCDFCKSKSWLARNGGGR